MLNSPFDDQNREVLIPENVDVVFVADMFRDDYEGGAELTTDALIKYTELNVFQLRSKDITLQTLESGVSKYWVFTNFSQMNLNLIPSIAANLKYSIVEYDYKFCRYRSIEKHAAAEMKPCNCHNEDYGKIISALFYGAKSIWWMSERQQEIYLDRFPFLSEIQNSVLSSVFDDDFFVSIKNLKKKNAGAKREKYIVLGSSSWIKGAGAAEEYCKKNKLDYEVVWGIPYQQMLEKLSKSKGFVYLPEGGDTCPRMVIEAKLLGCELILNEHVQHATELWFNSNDNLDTESYLYAARETFWKSIKHTMNFQPTISAYTTTLDCIKNNYPWEMSIKSMLGFADEVVVVDGGSTDGTWEKLLEMESANPTLKVKKIQRDWDDSRFAVFDGDQKAKARELCTSEFCWQQDADEIVHENDYQKIKDIVRNFPRNANLVSLPLIEYWGSSGKTRVDINPWKWRLSRNVDEITHGIPSELRKTDSEGKLYASLGTDGCDYVNSNSYERIPHASFYTEEVHNVRLAALSGNKDALSSYVGWMNRIMELYPTVHHYSWFNMTRKIKTYRDYWSKHWQSLYDIPQEDTAENNMFFQKPWSDVSDDDIASLANKLSNEMGGWIFHAPVDFSKPTPSMSLEVSHPRIVADWISKVEK